MARSYFYIVICCVLLCTLSTIYFRRDETFSLTHLGLKYNDTLELERDMQPILTENNDVERKHYLATINQRNILSVKVNSLLKQVNKLQCETKTLVRNIR